MEKNKYDIFFILNDKSEVAFEIEARTFGLALDGALCSVSTPDYDATDTITIKRVITNKGNFEELELEKEALLKKIKEIDNEMIRISCERHNQY